MGSEVQTTGDFPVKTFEIPNLNERRSSSKRESKSLTGDERPEEPCESVPVGGGLRAVRKLARGRGSTGCGDEDLSTSAGSDDDMSMVRIVSDISDGVWCA